MYNLKKLRNKNKKKIKNVFSLDTLNTHPLINGILIGLILGIYCNIEKENNIIKIKVVSDEWNINHIVDIYNLIYILNPEIIHNELLIEKNKAYFTISNKEIIKFFFSNFYLDGKYDIVYSPLALENHKNHSKLFTTSWDVTLYQTINNLYRSNDVVKYISRRIYRDPYIINICSISYWYLNMGYYDWRRSKYCIEVYNWDKYSLIRLLILLKNKWKLFFKYNQKKKLLLLDVSCNEYLEFYVNNYISKDMSWKIRNYWVYNKNIEYCCFLIFLYILCRRDLKKDKY